ncbi:MFS general substrate transporter [Vararia minispora EC-137]|uniref:MFS general substrate transporter n=1 Tax=Vararia minispora EC-137 TaxID=1314806 RepID=A0ACB8QDD6_9AGAM|nr:MFS general substrate transporter [Vararia minispora EC-137]
MSTPDSPSADSSTSTQATIPVVFPDGGVRGWMQVLGTFFFIFNSWGLVNSYGAFQTTYETSVLASSSPSSIAWIGSTQAFILLLLGSVSGPVFDRGYFTSQVIAGSFLITFGMFMTSLGTTFWQILLAQGVCFGLGAGLVFIPSVAVLATYFKRRRALVLGIAASASGLGGVVYPVILRQLSGRIGFGWATRIIAFTALGTLALSSAVMRRRDIPIAKRQLIDTSAFHDLPYVLFTTGMIFGFMASYIPFFYISAYATAKTSASPALAFYYVPILNAASIFGRIAPNWLADFFGAINVLIPCAFACAVLAFAWIRIETAASLLAFTILYGCFVGSFVSLPAAALANLTSDIKVVGTRMGMSFTCAGIGVLVGNPIAGALIDLEAESFVRMQVFCGVILLASGLFMAAARVAKTGFVQWAWV